MIANEEKKAEIDPLPGTIEETVDETERLEGLVMEYKEKHGGMQSADFAAIKGSSTGKGFASANQNGVKGKSKGKI